MLYPLIGPRLHGWLDDLVSLLYIAGAFAVGLHGATLGVALAAAAVHFSLTRFTDYPQGTVKLIPFRLHAFIELGEGMAVVGATWLLLGPAPILARAFLTLMGFSQFVAFGFSDYGPARLRPRAS